MAGSQRRSGTSAGSDASARQARPGRRASPARVTSRDIAREAGVSQPTVSRALRSDPRVSPATAAFVEATARRLGYVPDAAARTLSTRRTGSVAIVVADITNPFYPELVEALHDELGRAGYRSLLLNERTDALGDEGIVGVTRGGVVDGVIVATATNDPRSRALLSEERTPVVQLVREVDDVGRDAVVAGNREGAMLAAELLVDLGHRHIGQLSGPENASTTRERDAGFAAALGRPGDAAPRRVGEYSHQFGYQGCHELLDLPEPPTALFCGNDVIALGALDAARRRRLRVPEQLSIVGFDDISLAGWESFRLTTVRQPLAEMAHEAARLLVWRIESGADEPPRRIVFPTELIQRGTTAPPAPPS